MNPWAVAGIVLFVLVVVAVGGAFIITVFFGAHPRE
jgi:hypothetical protein